MIISFQEVMCCLISCFKVLLWILLKDKTIAYSADSLEVGSGVVALRDEHLRLSAQVGRLVDVRHGDESAKEMIDFQIKKSSL